jgi:hypothetical protein
VLCRLSRGIAGEREGREGVVTALVRPSHCGERMGMEGVGVVAREVEGRGANGEGQAGPGGIS